MPDLRSRRGCDNCRRRRRKCDESRPRCTECTVKGIDCHYTTRFRWSATESPVTRSSTSKFGTQYSKPIQQTKKSNQIHLPQQEESDEEAPPTAEDDISQGVDCHPFEKCYTPALNQAIASETTVLTYQSSERRFALTYWFDKLCGILAAYDGVNNPYRKFSILVLSSPIVADTIVSHAMEWIHRQGQIDAESILKQQNIALRSLREAIGLSPSSYRMKNGQIESIDNILSAVLFQIANSYFIGWAGVDIHLAFAGHLLEKMDIIDKVPKRYASRFLVQRFAMLDVYTSLIQHRRPYLPSNCWIIVPNAELDTDEPSFREMAGCPQPILAYLAQSCNLLVDLQEGMNASDVLDKAFSLETQLRLYGYALGFESETPFNHPIDSTSVVQDIHFHNLGRCWYWCAHLFLQCRVYRDSKESIRVQRSTSTLIGLIKSIPLTCSVGSNLSIPLCLLALEVVKESDRQWIKQRNEEMRNLYPSKTRDETMDMIECAWNSCSD